MICLKIFMATPHKAVSRSLCGVAITIYKRDFGKNDGQYAY